jgi:hypothetical protein
MVASGVGSKGLDFNEVQVSAGSIQMRREPDLMVP